MSVDEQRQLVTEPELVLLRLTKPNATIVKSAGSAFAEVLEFSSEAAAFRQTEKSVPCLQELCGPDGANKTQNLLLSIDMSRVLSADR